MLLTQAEKGKREKRASQGPQDWTCQVLRERKELQGFQAYQALKAFQVLQVLQAEMDFLAAKVYLFTVLKPCPTF